ncbi:phosphoglycolate phosphatase [Roseobacter denitrificans]|uniref:phosphoglycolate phosphatase n=1 Tax=Roseobacter denitrificans (strain ATCC 33942 / OCh 114) TaxID=375451 RepID=Q162Y2_ROSDO|nr:phosphoglycolate phosphatase [Roseobacter denitrificans]ABG32961.1 phosphoglycolate phosphatase [Roseobacter denitrificans OCh 114]AVL54821.1 phosphoglycolate phosphatase [Roseobacter denitrificans]SFG10442.1 phosphoglycolate phosphatase [Roseobacter denitrificans OCh 114]
MAETKQIIFDLDGTLIDSAPDLRAAMNVALGQMGRAPLDLKTVIGFIGNGVEKLVARSLVATGGSDAHTHARALDLFLQAYAKDKVNLTKPFPGVLECLDRLKGAGIPMAVCTNKPHGPANEICALMGLDGYFDVIAGAQPHIPKKPDPAPLLAVIDALGGERAGTLYVGDSAVDYETARAAQVPFRLYAHGYLNSPLPDLSAENRFDDWARVDFS